jgi:DNA-binding CsgD family transcriptional regulator
VTRAEKVAKAQELRRSGLKLREIGEQMGAAVSTVDCWLNDPDLARLRARKASYAGVCEDCGGPTSGTSSGFARVPRWCRTCAKPHKQAASRRALAAIHADRDRQIEVWWNEGLSMNEIADRLGWSRAHVQVELHKLRERGYHIPYRYALTRPRFPEQVAT